MRLRKIVAGLAAAAALMGGLATGASSAVAAPSTVTDFTADNGSITLSGPGVDGRTFKAIRIGTYESAVIDGDKATSVEIGTPAGLRPAAETALREALGDTRYASDYEATPYAKAGNPLGFVGEKFKDSGKAADPQWSGRLRDFVTAFAKQPKVLELLEDASAPSLTGANGTAMLDGLQQGIYLVRDESSAQTGADKWGRSIPMVVGTSIAGKTKLNDQKLGEVEVKNQSNNAAPAKTFVNASRGGSTSVGGVGDTLNYTVAATLPNTTGVSPYPYAFTDYPGKGLTVDLTSVKVRVLATPAADITSSIANAADLTGTLQGKENKAASFTVRLPDVSKYAGQRIELTYTATINNEAVGPVGNDASVDPNGQGESTPGTASVKTVGFSFTKTGPEGKTPLDGAKFTVSQAKAGKTTYFKADGTPVRKNDGDAVTDDLKLGGTAGVFTLTGLAPGSYRVQETDVPAGFMAAQGRFHRDHRRQRRHHLRGGHAEARSGDQRAHGGRDRQRADHRRRGQPDHVREERQIDHPAAPDRRHGRDAVHRRRGAARGRRRDLLPVVPQRPPHAERVTLELKRIRNANSSWRQSHGSPL